MCGRVHISIRQRKETGRTQTKRQHVPLVFTETMLKLFSQKEMSLLEATGPHSTFVTIFVRFYAQSHV